MILLWPGLIILLALVPILVAAYLFSQRRKRKTALRYSSLSLVRAALPRMSPVRRHLPPALFLLALASLLVAMARPAAVYLAPVSQTTIMLVLDVSGSMGADDIPPTRIIAAKQAALTFVRGQKVSTNIGVVAFSNDAHLIQAPTTNRIQVEAAILSLTTGDNTAIGSGILKGLEAIDQMNHQSLPPVKSVDLDATPVAPGKTAIKPDIIVLLTDGDNNNGPYPLDAARLAADQGVRIFTIGYGPEIPTTNLPQNPFRDPQKVIPDTGGSGLDGNKGGLNSLWSNYDVQMLQSIARLTGGTSYAATGYSSLEKVFARLPIQIVTQAETREISAVFVALGAILALAAMVLSMLWHPLP